MESAELRDLIAKVNEQLSSQLSAADVEALARTTAQQHTAAFQASLTAGQADSSQREVELGLIVIYTRGVLKVRRQL